MWFFDMGVPQYPQKSLKMLDFSRNPVRFLSPLILRHHIPFDRLSGGSTNGLFKHATLKMMWVSITDVLESSYFVAEVVESLYLSLWQVGLGALWYSEALDFGLLEPYSVCWDWFGVCLALRMPSYRLECPIVSICLARLSFQLPPASLQNMWVAWQAGRARAQFSECPSEVWIIIQDHFRGTGVDDRCFHIKFELILAD